MVRQGGRRHTGEEIIHPTDATIAQAIGPAESGERWGRLRIALAALLTRAALASMILTFALSPWRYRWVILERPFPPVYGDYTDFLLFPSDIALVVALAAWLGARLLNPRPLEIGPRFLTIPLAGALAAIWLSVPFSIDPALSFYHALRYLPLVGLYLVMIDYRPKQKQILLAVGALILTQAPLGILQVLNQWSLGLQALGEYELNPAWSGVSVVMANGARLLRAYALTDHPNVLGGLLAFALLLVAAGSLQAKRTGLAGLAGLFGLGMAGLLMTFSRAAALSFAIGSGVGAFLIWRRRPAGDLRRWLIMLGIGAVVIIPFAASYTPFIGARLNAADSFQNEFTERRSLYERADLNQAANAIFADHALTGAGVGTLPRAIRIRYPEFTHHYQPAHFVLLDAAAETGLFGALFYGAALGFPWLALVLLYRRRKRLPQELIAASVLLAAITVVGLFDYYPWLLQPGRLWQFLAWGLWASAYLGALQEAPGA